MKKNNSAVSIYLLVFITIFIMVSILNFLNKNEDNSPYEYSHLINDLTNNDPNDISRIDYIKNPDSETATAKVWKTDGDNIKYNYVDIIDIEGFAPYLDKAVSDNITVKTDVDTTGSFIEILIPILFFVAFIMIIGKIFQANSGGASKGMNFGKSKAKMHIDISGSVTFDNVAGLDEEKRELDEVVQFLKNPAEYTKMGARIPKGFLLEGPPGTGKTLLAKAVAGESSVPFFSISGSDFVEMYVGVGASRVRDLFAQAKKNSPCLIFIDEIDAVGRKRGAGHGGGHDEREQTLNQLLVEMDGFAVNEGIIVLAATNRVDILDPALLRPGRFDRKVVVNPPDVKGRLEMLHLHAQNKTLNDDVDFQSVAGQTSGFTGADIENLLNEAAIIAVREKREDINMECIRQAFIKVGIGTEKANRLITPKDRKITAYHEAGHAILHEMLTELDRVQIVSIIPTGNAGGYTMYAPINDNEHLTKTKMYQEIMSLLGGRIAEDIFFGEITTGASSDISRATKTARAMVTKYGMSSLGPIQYAQDETEVFMGRDYGSQRNYGETMASKIDEEVQSIINKAYEEAKQIILDNEDICHASASLLLEKEKITGAEFRELFPEGLIPEKEERVDISTQLTSFEEEIKERQEQANERRKKREEELKKKREELEKKLREAEKKTNN